MESPQAVPRAVSTVGLAGPQRPTPRHGRPRAVGQIGSAGPAGLAAAPLRALQSHAPPATAPGGPWHPTPRRAAGGFAATGGAGIKPMAGPTAALRLAAASLSLSGLHRHGGPQSEVPGAGSLRATAQLPALWLGRLAVRPPRPVYRLEPRRAARAFAGADQQHAFHRVALGCHAQLGQPRAESGLAPSGPGLAAQIRPAAPSGGDLRDTSRFTGACYRAANWIALGQTTGRTRNDRSNRPQVCPKAVWVYPLDPQFRRHLCA